MQECGETVTSYDCMSGPTLFLFDVLVLRYGLFMLIQLTWCSKCLLGHG